MSDLKPLLLAIAIAARKDHILWQINHDLDTWDAPESKREHAAIQAESKAATDAYIAAGGLVTNRSFTGYHGGNLSHYDIDETIVKKFGRDRVCADSESGGFFAYTDATIADELDAFLKDKFPGLEYGIHDNDDPTPLSIDGGWCGAEKLLKEAGITVDYAPKIEIPVKSAKDIGKLIDEASHSLLMTGLISEEDIGLMLDKYRG